MDRDNMPLLCTICEKKPKFSDVSHLLTHISSKQHLSNYFRIQVLSNGDTTAQAALDQYNAWYTQWDMSDMLKERMNQKEKKKTNTARGGSRVSSTVRKNVKKEPGHRRKATTNPEQGFPPEAQVKLDNNYHPYLQAHAQPYGTNFYQNPLSTSLQTQPTTKPYFKTEEESSSEDAAGEDEEEYIYSADRYKRTTRASNRLFSSSYNEIDDIDVLEDPELQESLKLKGVIWPGMLLFDSATPEMQRRRNQKKDTNVVARLEATSKIIGRDELIFNMSGDFLQQRDICAGTEPNTPLKGESTPEPDTPPVKKRKTRSKRARPALRDQDVNTGVNTRRSRRSHATFGDSKKSVANEASDDVDNAVTYEGSRKNSRAGLSIHRDNTGPDITFNHPQGQNGYSMPYTMSGVDRFAPSRVDTPMGAPATYGHMQDDYFRHSSVLGQFRAINDGHGLSAPDLSAFGAFQPSYNPFSAVESVQQRPSAFDIQRVAAQSLPMSMQRTLTTFGTGSNIAHGHQPWNHLGEHDDHNVNFGFYDNQNHNDAGNPLFFGSDLLFPEDLEALPAVQPKEEPDAQSEADTISLAGDQK